LSSSVIRSLEHSGIHDCNLPYTESATFFSVNRFKTSDTKVCIEDVITFFEPNADDLKRGGIAFMNKNEMQGSPDVVMLTSSNSTLSNEIANELFPNSVFTYYQHLCGEHYAASAFASGLATRIIETKEIPSEILLSDKKVNPRNVLIFNQSGDSYYSLILLKAC